MTYRNKYAINSILPSLILSAVLCAFIVPHSALAQSFPGDALFSIPKNVQTRWANGENWDAVKGAAGKADFGRKGSPCRRNLKAGESFVMAHAEGQGCVRRIWVTINDRSPKMLRGLKLEMFWDGAAKPAVQVPLGDFFGVALGRNVKFENAFFGNPEGRSFNCCIPMPFKKGMKIVATNESDTDLAMFFYEVNFTLGDPLPPDAPYFHSHYRRENPTTLRKDFVILPRVSGRGRFLGCNLGTIVEKDVFGDNWWGEGEVKIYLDGDREFPTLCGTGTEDYIGTGWGQGPYSHRYQGCPIADHERGQYAFYRYHVPDPVYFHQDIKVTIQQLGFAQRERTIEIMEKSGLKEYILAGSGEEKITLDDLKKTDGDWWMFERFDDWCATSYFYLDSPTSDLPPIESAQNRIAGLTGD